jgi:Icc-related predicted phosphoesterase
MTRRLTVVWPDRRPFDARAGQPIRLLAVSDLVDPALAHAINRQAIGRLDAVVGCGDLEPSYLGFLGDAFGVPVAYVRGNHDRGGHWSETATHAPTHLSSGHLIQVGGITVAPFEWPGLRRDEAPRDEWLAWRDVIRAWRTLLVRRVLGRRAPVLVVSHAPPRGVGDHEANRYHLGYAAYRWLLDGLRPPLWIHGHVNPATIEDWRETHGSSMVANVTGSVVVELVPPEAASAI